MPPPPTEAAPNSRASKIKKLKATITKLAEDLIQKLQTRSPEPTAADTLRDSVRKHIRSIHQHQSQYHLHQTPGTGLYGDRTLDRLGTNLWNQCAHVRREIADKGNAAPQKALLLASRVLAFQIIHLVQWEDECPPETLAYLMRLALKAARSCIEEQDMELGQIVVQHLAEYEGRAEKVCKGDIEAGQAHECSRLRAEYYGVRVALCWKENQLEVAEHMYAQVESLLPSLDHNSAESLAEVLYEIGRDLAMVKRDFPMASKWLKRSNDIISSQSIGQLSAEGVGLRLSIFQAHITALLGLESPEGFEQARELVGYLETEIGNQPFVLILNLELLSKSPAEVFDSEAYGDVLRRMIKAFKYTDANFKALKRHIQKLHEKSPGLGVKILDEFLVSVENANFGGGDGPEWYDKLVVLRVKMTTQLRESMDSIRQAKAFFSKLGLPVGTKAATGSQMLIWKMIDASYSQGHCDVASEWCHLALAPVFQDSGPINKAKIERKLLLCSLSLNDLPAALCTYHGMAEQAQKEVMTRYLMFKVAARSGDFDLATQCLETLSASDKGEDLLYACVLDAQKAGDNTCVSEALKRLVQSGGHKTNGSIHLPTLLRCTIRYLHKLLEDGDSHIDQSSVVSDIILIFDQAVKGMDRNETDAGGNRLFDLRELEWFCQNSYNLAIKNTQTWDPRQVVRILDACIRIAGHFPLDASSPVASDLPLRRLFCHFVSASALTALARGQDEVEKQLLDYQGVRQNVAGFEAALDTYQQSEDVSPADYRHLLKKLQTIIIFDLEAAIHLKQFSQLGEVARRAVICENADTFKAMADCLLRLQGPCQIPSQELYSTLNFVITQLAELQDYNSATLSRYIRCLFQATMGLDPDLAFNELKTACDVVKRSVEVEGSPWPREELGWIAIVAYNHGLDCSSQEDEERAQRWIHMAINLAHYNDDKGRLERQMHESYMSLSLRRQGGRTA
ncbi:hypothetical protein RB594_004238 [Gaeumannomyces avenae]